MSNHQLLKNDSVPWSETRHVRINFKQRLWVSSTQLTSLQVTSPFFFFFFCGRYSPWWTLASFTIALHWSRYCDFRLKFPAFIIFESSSTESSHLIAGMPTRRVPSESALLPYRDRIFQFPTRESSIFLGRFTCFRPAPIVQTWLFTGSILILYFHTWLEL
jgi:hypothetical protein